VAGINFNGERFKKQLPDSSGISNYTHTTLGFFIQDDWRISNKLILETGFRFDHHSEFYDFGLPRFSLLYKISHVFTTRVGGGLGYKTPSFFSSELDERDYKQYKQVISIKPERSAGLNWDINYRNKINEWDLTVNQTFFITSIHQPLVLDTTASAYLFFKNAISPVISRGFETYIQLQHDKLEIYLGYTFTNAKKTYDGVHPNVSLSARNKFASVVAYEFSDQFRAGIEAAVTGRQYLDNGRRTPAYLFAAAMMRYDIGRFSFVLNCENIFDYRQTKKENIVSGNPLNPTFNQLWASIDGRVINFSVRIKL
jgi:outer membrane receptor for ferrienterochelin and colicin